MKTDNTPVLKVENLQVVLRGEKKKKQTLLHDSSFEVYPGECLGILGESGSGKSLTVQGALGLLEGNFDITGKVFFDNRDLLKESKNKLRNIRGKEIVMVLQNPMTAFDPLCRIGDQIRETFAAHDGLDQAVYEQDLLELFVGLQLPDPQEILRKYPHQLSGGMLQRVMIALALVMKPKLLIADEPTTALDALTQFEVLQAFHRIKEKHQTAMIFISHDLGAVAYLADRLLVMNQGRIVDKGDFAHIMHHAQDPYTRLLIEKKLAVMERYQECLNYRVREELA